MFNNYHHDIMVTLIPPLATRPSSSKGRERGNKKREIMMMTMKYKILGAASYLMRESHVPVPDVIESKSKVNTLPLK